MADEFPRKLRVGFYGVTGCAGCLLSVIFNENELLDIAAAVDIVSFPFIKENNDDKDPLDIVFIEGVVVSNDDEREVKELRERSKTVVALGACAHLGNIPQISKFRKAEDLENLKYEKNLQNADRPEGPTPLSGVIKIDFTLPGCPPDREEIKEFIKQTLLGKKFRGYKESVCVECKLRENACLLDKGKICLGPLIAGGCNAVCPTGGLKCYGCRGFIDDANFDAYFQLMDEKKIPRSDVKKVFETFLSIDTHNKLAKYFE